MVGVAWAGEQGICVLLGWPFGTWSGIRATNDKLGPTSPKTHLGARGHKPHPFSKSREGVLEGN